MGWGLWQALCSTRHSVLMARWWLARAVRCLSLEVLASLYGVCVCLVPSKLSPGWRRFLFPAAGSQDIIYGWVIQHAAALTKPLPNLEMRRRFRSLFVLLAAKKGESKEVVWFQKSWYCFEGAQSRGQQLLLCCLSRGLLKCHEWQTLYTAWMLHEDKSLLGHHYVLSLRLSVIWKAKPASLCLGKHIWFTQLWGPFVQTMSVMETLQKVSK